MSSKQGWMTCFPVWSQSDQVPKGRCWWQGHWVRQGGAGQCPSFLRSCSIDDRQRGKAGPGPPAWCPGFVTALLFVHSKTTVPQSLGIWISVSGKWDGHNPSQEWHETMYLEMLLKLWSTLYVGYFLFLFFKYMSIFIPSSSCWKWMPCWVNYVNPESQMGAHKVNRSLVLFYFILLAGLRFKKLKVFRPFPGFVLSCLTQFPPSSPFNHVCDLPGSLGSLCLSVC